MRVTPGSPTILLDWFGKWEKPAEKKPPRYILSCVSEGDEEFHFTDLIQTWQVRTNSNI